MSIYCVLLSQDQTKLLLNSNKYVLVYQTQTKLFLPFLLVLILPLKPSIHNKNKCSILLYAVNDMLRCVAF